jgi:hypothetical protein
MTPDSQYSGYDQVSSENIVKYVGKYQHDNAEAQRNQPDGYTEGAEEKDEPYSEQNEICRHQVVYDFGEEEEKNPESYRSAAGQPLAAGNPGDAGQYHQDGYNIVQDAREHHNDQSGHYRYNPRHQAVNGRYSECEHGKPPVRILNDILYSYFKTLRPQMEDPAGFRDAADIKNDF